MDIWDDKMMPMEQGEGDAGMAEEVRGLLLASIGQAVDGIYKGTMQQIAKASHVSAENTLLWAVKLICRKTLERHSGDTDFVNEQADILVNSFFGQPNVSFKVIQCINEMKSEAERVKRQMELEKHQREMERLQAGTSQTKNVQNLFGSNSVKGEGNMNVGGGSISM